MLGLGWEQEIAEEARRGREERHERRRGLGPDKRGEKLESGNELMSSQTLSQSGNL